MVFNSPVDTLPHLPISTMAKQARQSLTPNEQRFWRESHVRWPGERFRRYRDISIRPTGTIGEYLSPGPSVWYAPFYHTKSRTIIIIDDRPDFPYRVYGQNWKQYLAAGYMVLDFSEDLSCPVDESVWRDLFATIDPHLLHRQAA